MEIGSGVFVREDRGETEQLFAVAYRCNFLLLRAWLFRESTKELLRNLYTQITPLHGSGSVELSRSVLLRAGAPGSWKLDWIRTRPK